MGERKWVTMSMSKSSRAKNYYNSIKAERKKWKLSQPEQCCWCLAKVPYERLEVHEIDRRSQLPNKWWPLSGSNGLLLCHDCHHGVFDNREKMPHAKQLAIKLLHDSNRFDLREWLSLKPRGPEYVTMAEVMYWVREILA